LRLLLPCIIASAPPACHSKRPSRVSFQAPLPRVIARERSDRSNPKSLAPVRPIAHNTPHRATRAKDLRTTTNRLPCIIASAPPACHSKRPSRVSLRGSAATEAIPSPLPQSASSPTTRLSTTLPCQQLNNQRMPNQTTLLHIWHNTHRWKNNTTSTS